MSTDISHLAHLGREPEDWPATLEALATGWIRIWSLPRESPERRQLGWAFDAGWELADGFPDLAWAFVLLVLRECPNNAVFSALAAGPLEDLIEKHGPVIIDRVEAEARRDPVFRRLLGGVWLSRISVDIQGRVQAAMGSDGRW